MRCVKIPKKLWPETYARFIKKHYYIARVFVPGTEEHRAVVDEFDNVLGAVSYSIESDHVYVYSLGSRRAGVGSRLMAHVERVAAKRGFGVRLASERSAVGFYARRGYRKTPGQATNCKIFYMRLYFSRIME